MMTSNAVLDAMMNRKSIRRYTKEQPSIETIETIVRAGQQAPFAAQLGSVLLKRDLARNPFHAPLLFTILVDVHRMETVMAARGWRRKMSDLATLLLGIQDAALMAGNMVIAGESLGLGSCFLGATPYAADRMIEEYELPERVLPLVQLTMGYPAEDAPPRPRYPLAFALFEDRYPGFQESDVQEAKDCMDRGYLEQEYYRRRNAMIPLAEGGDAMTYENYSWTEHISRKLGQWAEDPDELLIPLSKYGFHLDGPRREEPSARR